MKNKDDENLAAYLKLNVKDVEEIRRKADKASGELELRVDTGSDNPDANNCRRGFANYSILGPGGFSYCTLQKNCIKKASDAMNRIVRCTDLNKRS